MEFPRFKDFEFRFGFTLLEVARELDLKPHKYPGLSGAEHEDLGAMPQVFTVSAQFPGATVTSMVQRGNPLKSATTKKFRVTRVTVRDGRFDFKKLINLFDDSSTGVLKIPGTGSFRCFFKKLTDNSREGRNGIKTVEMEFVETLDEKLTLFRVSDELQDMSRAYTEAVEIETLVKEKPSVVKPSLLKQAQAAYNDVLKFATEARQQISEWQTQISDIQDAVARPYNELTRLAADIEQTANKARSLYKTMTKYADLPYTIAKRLRSTGNLLTSIGRRFLPPPVDSKGDIIGEQFSGRVLTHSVVAGDTLESISASYYGSALMWECLAEANGIFDTNALAIGDILILTDFGGRSPTKIEIKPGKTEIGRAKCAV